MCKRGGLVRGRLERVLRERGRLVRGSRVGGIETGVIRG